MEVSGQSYVPAALCLRQDTTPHPLPNQPTRLLIEQEAEQFLEPGWMF